MYLLRKISENSVSFVIKKINFLLAFVKMVVYVNQKLFEYVAVRNGFLSKVFMDGRKKRVRLYLKKSLSLEEFFRELNKRNTSYVVLRWFENLPFVEEGEDIDMIVRSEDLSFVLTFFTLCEKSGGQKFDIYPDRFDKEMNYNGLSYYPITLANKILNNCVYHNGLYRVPNHEYHKQSLIFHILFHKAGQSLFTFEGLRKEGKCDHDYYNFLKKLTGQEFSSMKDLYNYLYHKSFLPSLDTMKKYMVISKCEELKKITLMHEQKYNKLRDDTDVVMFVVREKMLDHGRLYQKLLELISFEGYEILSVVDEVNEEFIKNVRGGNWQKGPWGKSGGKPKKLIVAFNNKPLWHVNTEGFIQDQRIRNIKDKLRDYIKSKHLLYNAFNGLHTSDNLAETLEYASFLSKSYLNEINLKIKACINNNLIKDEYEVVEELTRFGRRAFAYKIKYESKFAFLKVFKLTCKSYCDAEINFYKFANKNKLPVPKMLDCGENYIITDYIKGKSYRPRFRNVFSWDKDVIELYLMFLDYCFENSYFNSDFAFPNNVLRTNDGCYFIDFEFIQKYQEKNIKKPYELTGVPRVHRDKYCLPHGYEETFFQYKIKMHLWLFNRKIHYLLSLK